MENVYLNVSNVIKLIRESSKKMYEVISELEERYVVGTDYGDEEYSRELFDTSESELEGYLVDYISSMDIGIRLLLEFFKLDKLYNKYDLDFAKYDKTLLKYYTEVGVLDSPVWGMMNDYVNLLVNFSCEKNTNNNIAITNTNGFKADITNKNENTVNVVINNKIKFIEGTKEVLSKAKSIDIDNEEINKELKGYINELEMSLNGSQQKVGSIKKVLNKMKNLFGTIAVETLTEEVKKQIPFIMKSLFELTLATFT